MALTRRDFLKASAVATTVAASGLKVFGPNEAFAADTVLIPHATHYGPFKAVVKDGKLIGVQAIKELDAMPTEMLLEGVLSRTYHPTRIQYPMVRRSYLENPRGNVRPELRGKDPFVRVSWEEALALVADASLRTIEEHGNEAIFSASYGGWSHAGVFRPQVLQGRLYSLIGGHSVTTGDYSGGASQISLPHIIGDMEVYSPQTAWEMVKDHTEVFVLVGCDPWKNNRIEFTVADHQMYPLWKKIRDSGVKFISINPQYTTTDDTLNSEWVKIIPNTDTALFTAMAYHVYTNGLHDQDYLDKYTVGFDKYLPYLLGEDGDNTPKTPEWAAEITGIPAEKIVELAELFASKRTQFAGAWSLQRAHHGEMTHWAIINFASMVGKIGKPGEGVGFSWHYGGGGMPVSDKRGPIGLSQGRNPVKTRCPASRISEMLNNPGKTYTRDGGDFEYPDVHMIYAAGNNFVHHQQNTNELLKAMEKVHTVVVQDPWWCASARYADIVLPASTTLERDDISSGGTYSMDKVYAMRQVIEPYGESLSDFEIFRRLAGVLGVEYGFTEGKTLMDLIKVAYANTDAELSFDEFWEQGYAPMAVPESARTWVRHGDFFTDPVAHPLHTESGKIEMYCEAFEKFQAKGCPPIPKFLEPAEYLGNAKEGQVHVVSPHPFMRLHSQMANASIREIMNVQDREFVLMSQADADERGIKDGDLVEVYNDRGALIGGARVSDKIMKGVISIFEGAWLSKDSKGRCNSGAVNILTTSIPSSGLSQANSANTCLASIRKCEDAEGPNQAYEPPQIDERESVSTETDIAALALVKRSTDARAAATVDMLPGERLFYERCTLCHVAREPSDHTIAQWKGITQSMFPRAGLTPEQQELVMEFLSNNAKDAVAP
ncbi:MAG TPA: molybdopterin-dependent oxidoreductase [Candidatus Paenalcaligenes intestinipullorum]|uniref:trimethylamine-N-oxide reductase n=1 Tax=Candidatus Paenalcaligenes intestinipullorum TaxID=2838718 RepID=A0A9D2RFT2_9BURK|nr:molybdopterin-dependent oxidoreductase [Candidatus Paenalcaligenes intestinipullorum]